MNENIYIKSYEYGFKHLSNGITYEELVEHLESQGIAPEDNFKNYFHYWFYESFYVPEIYNQIKVITHSRIDDISNLLPHDKKKAILTGDSQKEYLSYLKLTQAQQDSSNALRYSKVAIYISAILALLQIALQIFDMISDKKSICLWCVL